MKWSDERCDASMAATKPVVWTTLTWGLLVFAALLPIGLLSWYAWHLTAHAVRHLVVANNLSAAIPTVSLDVISLAASSCGYFRGQIEQRAAHEFAVHLAT